MNQGPVVDEVPVEIQVNGERVLIGTCSPYQLEAWAVGRLLSEGYLTSFRDVRAIEESGADHERDMRVELSLPAAQAGEAERRHRAATGCGVLHVLDCAPQLIRRSRRLAVPPFSTFPELYRELFEPSAEFAEGGAHTAALTDGRVLRYRSDDVGRHNAVDKVIGAAVIDLVDVGDLGLIVTSRISGEIAAKAARSGISWVASRSIPTTLAVRIAAAAAMPLISRAPGKDAFVHQPPPDVAS